MQDNNKKMVRDNIPYHLLELALAEGWEVVGYSEFDSAGVPTRVDIEKEVFTSE
jgi:hypothetical protein